MQVYRCLRRWFTLVLKLACVHGLLLLIGIPATPRLAFSENCIEGYQNIKLRVLKPPVLVGEKSFCNSALSTEEFKGMRFLQSPAPLEAGPGTAAIVEIRSPNEDVHHIFRSGISYGEYIDETFNSDGGHVESKSLLLLKARTAVPDHLENLRYVETEDDYIWVDRRVTQIKRRQRFVQLTYIKKVIPLGEWEQSTIERRVFVIDLKPALKYKDPLSVRVSYDDPFTGQTRLFRKFADTGQPQTTIIPFVVSDNGKTSPAYLEVLGLSKPYNKLKVEDPGKDGVKLAIDVK